MNYIHPILLYPDDKILHVFSIPYNHDLISYSLATAHVAIHLFMIGTFMNFSRHFFPKVKSSKVQYSDISFFERITLLVTIFFFFFIFFVLKRISGLQHQNPRIVIVIVALIAISFYLKTSFLSENRCLKLKDFFILNKMNIFSTFFFLISLFSIGSRSYGLNILLFIGGVINLYYCRFRFLQLVGVLVPMFIFMSVISITRLSPVNFSNSSVFTVFEYSYDYIIGSKDAFALLFTDFIVNNRNLYEEIDYSIKYGLLFGQTYIPYLFVIVPFGATLFSNYFLGKDLRQLNTGALITDINGAEVGLGSNAVGDLYMNFSYIGVFVMFFVFGAFVNYAMKSTSFYGRLLYFTLIAFSIYIPRADILSWLSLFMLMILFLCLRRVYVLYISILLK
ncbi:O-antigen polymerase [Bacteroides oleiciplenus]|uniref:O-antigen polymerase n=1 Tax=Bacteroides oleiciplenus TaxID=626931 RepID=UPI0011C1AED1|nr:O-antigen polymerase [Bacteroides oleiciplenus]